MRAHTPTEKLDALITLQAKVEAQIRDTLRQLDGEPAGKRSRLIVPECGTESAYQRHRHRGEEADEDCKAAHRLHNRVKYARAKYAEAS